MKEADLSSSTLPAWKGLVTILLPLSALPQAVAQREDSTSFCDSDKDFGLGIGDGKKTWIEPKLLDDLLGQAWPGKLENSLEPIT